VELLKAEMRVIELWDRAAEEASDKDETQKAGFKARRMRWLEINREIDALTKPAELKLRGHG
jgi:hypothetical protein